MIDAFRSVVFREAAMAPEAAPLRRGNRSRPTPRSSSGPRGRSCRHAAPVAAAPPEIPVLREYLGWLLRPAAVRQELVVLRGAGRPKAAKRRQRIV